MKRLLAAHLGVILFAFVYAQLECALAHAEEDKPPLDHFSYDGDVHSSEANSEKAFQDECEKLLFIEAIHTVATKADNKRIKTELLSLESMEDEIKLIGVFDPKLGLLERFRFLRNLKKNPAISMISRNFSTKDNPHKFLIVGKANAVLEAFIREEIVGVIGFGNDTDSVRAPSLELNAKIKNASDLAAKIQTCFILVRNSKDLKVLKEKLHEQDIPIESEDTLFIPKLESSGYRVMVTVTMLSVIHLMVNKERFGIYSIRNK